MKLKEQMNKQRAYAIRQMNEAKQSNDIGMINYWRGIVNAMDWVQGSRDKWEYIDGMSMPEDKSFSF